MKKHDPILHAADRYMAAATKRFAKSTKMDSQGENEFVSGFSWGAHAGYLAGHKAAMKRRSR